MFPFRVRNCPSRFIRKTYIKLKQLQVLLLLYLAVPSRAPLPTLLIFPTSEFWSVEVSGCDFFSNTLQSYILSLDHHLNSRLLYLTAYGVSLLGITNRHLETSYSQNTTLDVLHQNLVILLPVLSISLLQPSKKPWSHP